MDREAAAAAGEDDSPPLSIGALSEVGEGEGGAPLTAEGYFSLRQCDSASLSSFSMDTPSLPRKLNAQEDTDSLVSTGTLVPEAIYLPPAGHRLVTHSDWDALNAQASSLTNHLLNQEWTNLRPGSHMWSVKFSVLPTDLEEILLIVNKS